MPVLLSKCVSAHSRVRLHAPAADAVPSPSSVAAPLRVECDLMLQQCALQVVLCRCWWLCIGGIAPRRQQQLALERHLFLTFELEL